MPPSCIDNGNHPATPCTWHCWSSWGSHGVTPQACPGLSRWHPTSQVSPHHSARCTFSNLSMSLIKLLHRTVHNTGPWGTPFITDLHVDMRHCPSNQHLLHWTVHPSHPYLSNSDKCYGWAVSKTLDKFRQMISTGLPLLMESLHHRRPLGWSDRTLVNLYWLPQITFLFSMTFPHTELRLRMVIPNLPSHFFLRTEKYTIIPKGIIFAETSPAGNFLINTIILLLV